MADVTESRKVKEKGHNGLESGSARGRILHVCVADARTPCQCVKLVGQPSQYNQHLTCISICMPTLLSASLFYLVYIFSVAKMLSLHATVRGWVG